MKWFFSARGLFFGSILLVVVTNIFVAKGIYSNRTSQPTSLMTLTERELHLPYSLSVENTGLSLRLKWRTLASENPHNDSFNYNSTDWLNKDKLRQLGFTIPQNAGSVSHSRKQLPRNVFVVLEKSGKPYQESLTRAELAYHKSKREYASHPEQENLKYAHENATRRLGQERISESRLFAIDAGLSYEQMRAIYGDRERYLIVRGTVRLNHSARHDGTRYYGNVSQLLIENIHVPRQHRQIFDSLLEERSSYSGDPEPPRFEVQLAYGSRLEPWIVAVHELTVP